MVAGLAGVLEARRCTHGAGRGLRIPGDANGIKELASQVTRGVTVAQDQGRTEGTREAPPCGAEGVAGGKRGLCCL